MTDVAEPVTSRPATVVTTQPTRRRGGLFPGEQQVWRGAGAAILVLGIVLLVALLILNTFWFRLLRRPAAVA